MLLTKPLGVAFRTPPCTRRCQKYRYIAYYYICPRTIYLHFRQRLTYYYYYYIYIHIYIYVCMYLYKRLIVCVCECVSVCVCVCVCMYI
jgi:hypothetical protein